MSGTGAAGLGYGDLLLTSLLVLGGVCIAAFVVVQLVGRFLATGRSRGTQLLEVVARLPLEPRRSLYVVDVPGKTLLIGTSEMGLSVLSELDREQVRSDHVERHTFAELLRAAWQRRRGASANKHERAGSELTGAERVEPAGPGRAADSTGLQREAVATASAVGHPTVGGMATAANGSRKSDDR